VPSFLIVDDHAMVRLGVQALISTEPGWTVIGAVSSVAAARRLLETEDCDVAVVDLMLEGAGGEELVDWLLRFRPKVRIVMHSLHPEDGLALGLLRRGVAAYVHKGRDPEVLLAALRRAAAGGRFLTDTLADRALASPATSPELAPHEGLSERELQVFLLTVDGRSPARIAAELHVARSTISTHLRAVRDKLGASSNHDLVNYAHRAGLRRV
jgi:DNA-binding NarL/FixJ family response regulator